MFKFTDLSDNDEFKAEDYRLNPKEFFEKRRTSRRPYVFDLRSANDYELSHLPGSHNLPIEHFENSVMDHSSSFVCRPFVRKLLHSADSTGIF